MLAPASNATCCGARFADVAGARRALVNDTRLLGWCARHTLIDILQQPGDARPGETRIDAFEAGLAHAFAERGIACEAG
jgi:hypothetical protein